MSIKIMTLVWESYLPSNEKFVLLALADHARDDGSRVYPSIETISKKTGFSERTVQRQMRKLQALGVLEIVKGANRYGTTEYLIRGDKLTPLKGKNRDIQGCQPRHPGVTTTTSRGDNHDIQGCQGDTQYIIEPSLTSSVKENQAKTSSLF